MTKIQILTIISLIGYAIWEIAVTNWASKVSGPIIRVDLILIYFILLILISISVYQFLRRN
ncbi:MAG: hypothetical protein ACRDA4_00670 [Filifactoraceae bacterium]